MKDVDLEQGEGSTSSDASQIVTQTIGTANDYLIRLLEKALEDRLQHRPVVDKFKPIATKLEQEIGSSKERNDFQSLLVNTLLREKLSDRSSAESNQKQKWILVILTIALPLVTNALQFALSYHFREVAGSE